MLLKVKSSINILQGTVHPPCFLILYINAYTKNIWKYFLTFSKFSEQYHILAECSSTILTLIMARGESGSWEVSYYTHIISSFLVFRLYNRLWYFNNTLKYGGFQNYLIHCSKILHHTIFIWWILCNVELFNSQSLSVCWDYKTQNLQNPLTQNL